MNDSIIIAAVIIVIIILLRIIFKIGKKLLVIILFIGLAFVAYSYFIADEDNNISKFIDEKIEMINK